MDLINEAQKDIYRLKDMMQIEMLRAYKSECLRKDLASAMDKMELEINRREEIIYDLPKVSDIEQA